VFGTIDMMPLIPKFGDRKFLNPAGRHHQASIWLQRGPVTRNHSQHLTGETS
jgi:hypothetical protein